MSDTTIAIIIGTVTLLIAAFIVRKLYPPKNKTVKTEYTPTRTSFNTHIAPPSNRQRYTPARGHRVRFRKNPVKPMLDPLTGRPLKFKRRKKGDH